MDERLKFIARLLDGDQMSALCREVNISRKTGYKLMPDPDPAAAARWPEADCGAGGGGDANAEAAPGRDSH